MNKIFLLYTKDNIVYKSITNQNGYEKILNDKKISNIVLANDENHLNLLYESTTKSVSKKNNILYG